MYKQKKVVKILKFSNIKEYRFDYIYI